jgi:hypothetical protein
MIKVQNNTYDSSTVQSSSYNYEHKTLTVHFGHASYIYYEVSVMDYVAFVNAKSQGQALNLYIKDNYRFEKINEVKKVENI